MVLQADSVTKKMEMRRNLILQYIYRNGPIGRLQLGRNLRMSKSRLCEVVQEMIDGGLIIERLTGTERRGRNPVPLVTNPDYGCFVGLDFEANRMRMVVVDFSGQALYHRQRHLRPMKNKNTLVVRLLDFIDEGLRFIRGLDAKILGIGVAAPGIINRWMGMLVHYDLIEAARNIPLRDLVENHTGFPCVVDNNIRCYALTEWTTGVARNMSNFICLAVRSGVGSAIILNGRLLDGSHGFSGEVGYSPVPNGQAASQWKTLQELVSEKALNVDDEAKSFSLSKEKAQMAGELVGAQAASLAVLLDPEAIVLAGALLDRDGPLWDIVEQTYGRFILHGIARRFPLLPSKAGAHAAAVGATQRCLQELYPTSSKADRVSRQPAATPVL